jgi:hypothetical protein
MVELLEDAHLAAEALGAVAAAGAGLHQLDHDRRRGGRLRWRTLLSARLAR